MKESTHARCFLAEWTSDVSSDEAGFPAVHFSQKDDFQVGFFLHFI